MCSGGLPDALMVPPELHTKLAVPIIEMSIINCKAVVLHFSHSKTQEDLKGLILSDNSSSTAP